MKRLSGSKITDLSHGDKIKVVWKNSTDYGEVFIKNYLSQHPWVRWENGETDSLEMIEKYESIGHCEVYQID